MGFFLFLRGYGGSDPERAARLSEATGQSPADARLLLLSRYPKSLVLHEGFEEAGAALEKLQSSGFEGFLAEQDEVERPPSIAEAGRAEFGEQSVSWWHAHRQAPASPDLGEIRDRTIIQTRKDVRAVFRANLRTFNRIESRVTRTSEIMKVRVSETRTEGVSTEGDREQALLIKGSGYDAFVLARENGFDFNCLGPMKVYGPGANIGRLASRLREIFPEAFHDDSLLQFAGEMGLSFKSSSSSPAGPHLESRFTDHHSNFNSVIRMARLISMQQGLA